MKDTIKNIILPGMFKLLKFIFWGIFILLKKIFLFLKFGIHQLSGNVKYPYESRQNLFLVSEIVVILVSLGVMYYYIPLWTITIILAYVGLTLLGFISKYVFGSFLMRQRTKPQKVEEVIHSFHFKNYWIGYLYYIMIINLSVTCSVVVYCSIVDVQYRQIYNAYRNSNVVLNALEKTSTFPEFLKQKAQSPEKEISYKRCLLELMRGMKLITADEYISYENGKIDPSKLGDYPNAILRILEVTGNFHIIQSTDKTLTTLQYLYKFNQELSGGTGNVSDELWPDILAAIFAQQPGIYKKSLDCINNPTEISSDKADGSNRFTIRNKENDDESKTLAQKIMEGYGDDYSIVNEKSRWTYMGILDWFFKPEAITDELTLRLLYEQLQMSDDIFNMAKDSDSQKEPKQSDSESETSESAPTVESEIVLNRQDGYFLRNWCANLISMLQDDPNVKTQKMYLSVIHGPEQFGMLIVFFLSFFIMIGRLIMLCWNRTLFFSLPLIDNKSRYAFLQRNDLTPEEQQEIVKEMKNMKELYIDELYPKLVNIYNSEEKDKESRIKDLSELLDYSISQHNTMEQRSRWLINWSAAALPSIGFIGTVRGLLLALGNADSIVRATNALGQAAAITDVATQLSLAFTTTLVALLLGLVISLLNYWQVKAERNYLSWVDIILRNHFNVWGQFTNPKKEA